jgi:hypothetical protein
MQDLLKYNKVRLYENEFLVILCVYSILLLQDLLKYNEVRLYREIFKIEDKQRWTNGQNY